MSALPQGRGRPFPIIWGNRARSFSVGESPVVGDPSDEEVLARLHEKDSNALDLLFDRYSRLVLSIGYRILHDYGEAEEVVQDTFFQVFQKANLFNRLKGTAKAWIVQIGYHRALDRKSYLARRGFYVGTEISILSNTLVMETDLDREIGANLDRVQLEKAFEDLSEIQRQTLELFYFEGFELREIAENLNEPLGNIRHHFYRGLEQLRRSAFVQRLREK